MTPTGPTRVTAENASRLFRRGVFPSPYHQVVVFHDGHRHTYRVVRFTGMCVVCDRPTWCADDGDNDPRGILGDGALHDVELEDHEDVVIRLCSLCANDYDTYKLAQGIARNRLRSTTDPDQVRRSLAPQPAADPRRRATTTTTNERTDQ